MVSRSPALRSSSRRSGSAACVGDQLVDLPQLADARERDLPQLRPVGDHDRPSRPLDQGPVRVRLDLVVGGAAGLGRDPVHADEDQVEVEARERDLGDRADELVGGGAGDPARHDQLQVRAHRQLGGDVERVRDHREPGGVPEGPGDLGGGRAAGEPDGRALLDQRGGRRGDPPLLLLVAGDLVAQRELVQDPAGDRAAVHPRDQALLLEQLQVAADGRDRDAEALAELRDAHAAVGRELVENRCETVDLAHARTIPDRFGSNRSRTITGFRLARL